jgi:AcrR family transcriptional regulator
MAKHARRSIGSQRNPASEQAILAAAQDLLAKEGPAGFTIEAVARRAHAGKPTIYRWWPSRAHLLLAVFERQREPDGHHDAAQDLEAALHDHLRHLMMRWRDTPAGPIFRSIIAEAQTDETAAKAVAEYVTGRRPRHVAWLANHLDAGQAETLSDILTSYALQRLAAGRLDAADPELQRVAAFLARCSQAAASSGVSPQARPGSKKSKAGGLAP